MLPGIVKTTYELQHHAKPRGAARCGLSRLTFGAD
jgi:hypothetical protein